jgi:hypothetical protein
MQNVIEHKIAEQLVTNALLLDYAVSVHDGEAFAVKRSSNKQEIIAALNSTDEDKLVFRKNGEVVGSVYLIWGNGADVISNYSDNEKIEALVNTISI